MTHTLSDLGPKTLWLAEKPSQAREIARVLGVTGQGPIYLKTRHGPVTWAIGHLFEPLEPDQYDPKYSRWSLKDLPIIVGPAQWKLAPIEKTARHTEDIGKLLHAADTVVIATDAGHEGELIAVECLDYFGYRGRRLRLWLHALDEANIKSALASLKDAAETRPWAERAAARQYADWHYGFNLTRAFTQKFSAGDKTVLSIGRVQTPTLKIVVDRDRAIESFRPQAYYVLTAKIAVTPTDGRAPAAIELRHPPAKAQKILSEAEAVRRANQARGASAPLEISSRPKRAAPPRLFSLDTLMAKASTRFAYSAQQTSEIAQALYEKQLISYPRTECEFLPESQLAQIPQILAALRAIPSLAPHCPATPVIRDTTFNSRKVQEHHAIVPLPTAPELDGLMPSERNIYLLVAARYLANLMPDREFIHTTVRMNANGLLFEGSGDTTVNPGWTVVDSEDPAEPDPADPNEDDTNEPKALPDLRDGDPATITACDASTLHTRPPPHYTEGTLIGAMKTVAKIVTDPTYKHLLKETSGIGTAATRERTVTLLKERGFLRRSGKIITSTPLGRRLSELVESYAKPLNDAAETAIWEELLIQVQQSKLPPDEFRRRTLARLLAILKTTLDAPPLRTTTKAEPPARPATQSNNFDQSAKTAYAARAGAGIPIAVPRQDNQKAKTLGALWDNERKTWVIPAGADPAPFHAQGWL